MDHDSEHYVFGLLFVLFFAIGCMVGWVAHRDQAKQDRCSERCAPALGVARDGACYCLAEAKR